MSELQKNREGELSPLVCVYRQAPQFSVEDFRAIYTTYHKTIFTIAFKFLKDKFLAEDAIQEVFIKLWNYKEEIDLNKNIGALIVTITRNHLLNMLRSSKAEAEKRISSLHHTSKANENDTEFSFGWKLHLAEFQQCMKEMSPRKREIFSMKILEGYTNEEIAQSLGLSVNTVKFQYSDAKSIVKKSIGI
jgi:RNA polymerase sigma-70 factor (ECF subfamily)